jgi:hypothetical protein
MAVIPVAYGRRSQDLCRFTEDPADGVVTAFLREASDRSTEQQGALRDRLSADDCYNLMTFARRRSASGIRQGALDQAVEATQALTYVTKSKIDYRDLSVDFPLYAIGRLGGNLVETIAAAAAASEPGTRASFVGKADRAARMTLKDCALMEVRSRYGLGFIDTWAEPYAPQADLAGIAVRMADWIDSAGRHVVEDLHLSGLPEVWFEGHPKPTANVVTTGCVSISAWIAGGSPFGRGLLAFLAEVESIEVASRLAARAQAASVRDRPRTAGSRDRLLLVLVGGSATRGQAALETDVSLRPVCEALLGEIGG